MYLDPRLRIAENLQKSSLGPLERKLGEIALWYSYNRDLIPPSNIGKRLAFAETAISNLLDLASVMTERMQLVEGSKTRGALIVPGHPDFW